MNLVNNTERKTLTADEDKWLFVTGKDIRYFCYDAFLLESDKIWFEEHCL